MTTSAQFRIRIRVHFDATDAIGAACDAIAETGARIGEVASVEGRADEILRDFTVDATSVEHWPQIIAAIEELPGAEVLSTADRTLEVHEGGKLEQRSKHPLETSDDLAMAYTPGVARVCLAIDEDPELAYKYTIKRNTVAVVTDGSAVLGLGDIGAKAAMPVMEGKCCLFKEFAGVDAFPIALDSTDTQEIIEAVKLLAPAFGGINLEDIAAPRCFEIERTLREQLEIPVFHDDQHGTAVVVLAALLNAAKLTGRSLDNVRVLVIGVGAAGVAVTEMLMAAGVRYVVGCDSRGALSTAREDYVDGTMNEAKRLYADRTNPDCRSGRPEAVIDGMDLVIGLSGARVLAPESLARMNRDAMIFAMANPTPEVDPADGARYARIIATGRSDYPNQINNVLAFPGIFRGALDARVRDITMEMQLAAARAIANIVGEGELRDDYIIPSALNRAVVPVVAQAIRDTALTEAEALAAGGA